jgi:hypothetical protein
MGTRDWLIQYNRGPRDYDLQLCSRGYWSVTWVLSWVLECSVGVVVDSWVLEGSQKLFRLEKKKTKVITLRRAQNWKIFC